MSHLGQLLTISQNGHSENYMVSDIPNPNELIIQPYRIPEHAITKENSETEWRVVGVQEPHTIQFTSTSADKDFVDSDVILLAVQSRFPNRIVVEMIIEESYESPENHMIQSETVDGLMAIFKKFGYITRERVKKTPEIEIHQAFPISWVLIKIENREITFKLVDSEALQLLHENIVNFYG